MAEQTDGRLKWTRVVEWLTLVCVAAVSAWLFSAAVRHRSAVMPWLEDDFFYYAKIAANIAAGRGSTFDGTTPTNGYHPLYLLLLLPAAWMKSGLTPFLVELWVLAVAASMTTFIFARRIFRAAGCEVLLANGLALLALLLVAVLLEPRLRAKLSARAMLAFAIAAGVPLLLYLANNHLWFGTWMPISGMAKQLRFSHAPSRMALHSAWFGKGKLLLAMTVLALAAWLVSRRNLRPELRVILLAAILLPLVQTGVFCILSDWQMWGWYHYAFTPTVLALFVLLAFWWNGSALTRRWGQVVGSGVLLAGVALTATNRWKTSGEMTQIGEAAEQLQVFAATHSGTYAMGDRSGMVAWMLPEPLFQTEGLVEDRAWVNTIRSQQDLAAALRARSARYYVTTVWESNSPGYVPATAVPVGCTLAVEPMQAGPTAPHLQSVFCGAPVAEIKIPAAGEFPAKRVLVFDLQPQTN